MCEFSKNGVRNGLIVIVCFMLPALFLSTGNSGSRLLSLPLQINNPAPSGGSLRVQVSGVTATQAVLSYTAPSTSSCSLQVSENSSLSPVVHDVDPALFPASNFDSGGAANRTWVVGRRTVSLASDGVRYSRALQTATAYFFQLTCGTQSAAGTFTTMNIPWGNTWADVTPAQFPTGFSTDRTKNYIDPLTGVKVFLVTRYNGRNADWDDGGSPTTGANGTSQMCAGTTVNNGAGTGYHCNISIVTGDAATYWIKSDGSGSANFIGLAHFRAGKDVNGYSYRAFFLGGNSNPWDGTNGNVMYSTDCTYEPCDNKLVKITYTGNDSFAGKNVLLDAHSTKVVLTGASDIPTLVHAFDSTFNPAIFRSCGVSSVQLHYIIGNCTYSGQQSPAWLWVYDLKNNNIVAAVASYTNIESRWCGSHGTAATGQSPFTVFGTANLTYEVKLEADVTSGDTAFTISGQPVGTPLGLKSTQVGDYFSFEDNGEIVKVSTTNTSSTSWTVLRGQDSNRLATSHRSGTKLVASCTGQPNAFGKYVPTGITKFWDFVHDPHGMDVSNAFFVSDSYSGCHEIERPGIKSHCDEAGAQMIWSSNANIFATLNHPPDFRIADHPLFSGFNDLSIGFHQSHPSYDQTQAAASEQTYIQDIRPFLGGGGDSVTLVAGKRFIYKYLVKGHNFSSNYPYFGLGGSDGKQLLADISGPGSVLADDAVHNNTMCIAKLTNECISGSSPGDIYVNVSGTPTECGNTCIWNSSPFADSIAQLGTVKPTTGLISIAPDGSPLYGAQRSRAIIRGLLGPIRKLSQYANTHILPNASLTLFEAPWIDGVNSIVAAAKVPPQPLDDGIDRSNYEPVRVSCSGADKYCRLRYGYEENEPTHAVGAPVIGSTMHFYCTQRKQECDAPPKPANQPQTWRIGIPQRVLWSQVQYCSDPNCRLITSMEALRATPIP